jgi:hypothetical protein
MSMYLLPAYTPRRLFVQHTKHIPNFVIHVTAAGEALNHATSACEVVLVTNLKLY